jgi:hypothetical protein
MNFEKIERAGHVLYMCLDSLPDPSVASAIGALALADQAARAGMRYNLGGYRRIALFVDEVSNVINQPLIEILNKGAEGGIFTTCAMQTLADLAKRLGSEDAARMALGNLNNLIALRTKDRPTQDFVVETFGKTAIHTVRVGLSHGSDAHLGDFSSSYSTQLTESFEEMVPADVLGKLPNLQYFASVSGGRIIKGRFPILDPDGDSRARRRKNGRMIRAVAVLSLLVLLVLVLYVPSAHPPERFLSQLRAEHEAASAYWGAEPATRMLDRAMSMQDSTAQVTPIPAAKDAPSPAGVNAAVSREMSSVNQRLFNNAYFRAVDALLLLASYRLSTLLEWLPWLAVFVLAAVVDGGLARLIKAKEFLQHDPEMFAFYASLGIVILCATVIGFVLPVTLHPLLLPCVPLVVGVLAGRALGCFHRRG